MQKQKSHFILGHNNKPKENGWSFFACLNCYPEEGQMDENRLSIAYNRQDYSKVSMNPGPSSERSSHLLYLTSPDIRGSTNSLTYRESKKISIKNRKSGTVFQRQSIILPESENVSDFLPQSNGYLTSTRDQVRKSEGFNIGHSNLNCTQGSMGRNYTEDTASVIRQSMPTVAFSYQKPFQKINQNSKSNYPQYPSILDKKASPAQKVSSPRLVVSKQIDQSQRAGIFKDSRQTNSIPYENHNIEYCDKKKSSMSNEREVYNSIEPPPQLNNKKSSSGTEPKLKKKKSTSKDGLPGGRFKLKVRQVESIKYPEDEDDDDDSHESFVLQSSKGQGLLNGLLVPISESDEFKSPMGTTVFSRMRDNQ